MRRAERRTTHHGSQHVIFQSNQIERHSEIDEQSVVYLSAGAPRAWARSDGRYIQWLGGIVVAKDFHFGPAGRPRDTTKLNESGERMPWI